MLNENVISYFDNLGTLIDERRRILHELNNFESQIAEDVQTFARKHYDENLRDCLEGHLKEYPKGATAKE